MNGEYGRPRPLADWRLREYREADIPSWVEISNLEYPDEPTTLEQEQYWERAYPRDNPRLRLAAEDAGCRVIAMGACEKPFWAIAPGVYTTHGVVHPDCRRRGIGRELLGQLETYAVKQGAQKLWTECRESQADSRRFLQAAGFREFGLRLEQAIDLTQFDLARFSGALERVERAGYRLTTLAELRRQSQDADWLLYQVCKETELDVPFPGGLQISMDFQQWLKDLESPTRDPDHIFCALKGEQVVGETTLDLTKGGPATTDSTGVTREHRRRGIAMALKLKSLQALKERGYREARTHNDTGNPAILHLNEKLGYRRLPGWLQWEKRLDK